MKTSGAGALIAVAGAVAIGITGCSTSSTDPSDQNPPTRKGKFDIYLKMKRRISTLYHTSMPDSTERSHVGRRP